MRARRQENPLGIRKLDVQGDRRTAQRDAHATAVRWTGDWFGRDGISDADRVQVERLVRAALCRGWEDGLAIGALRTRDRVREALATGALVKPEEAA